MLLFGVSALTCQTGRESAGSGTNVVVPGLLSGYPVTTGVLPGEECWERLSTVHISPQDVCTLGRKGKAGPEWSRMWSSWEC